MALEHGESVAGATKKKKIAGRCYRARRSDRDEQQRGESSFTGVNEPGVAAFFERFRGACAIIHAAYTRVQ